MVPFKCDVHGWMNAYVGVLDHPFFAVTDKDGKFSLQGPAAGDVHDRGVAREGRHADRERDRRREGNQGRQLHVQGSRGHGLTSPGRTGWTGRTGRTGWQAKRSSLPAPAFPARPAYPARVIPVHASPFRQARRRLHGTAASSPAASSRAPARVCRFPIGRPRTAGTCLRSRLRSGSAASSTNTATA